MGRRRPLAVESLAWGESGLLPVIVQEVASGSVLMLAWADREAVTRTLERGEGWFWSRSRERLWKKGESSGHTLAVAEVATDCDGDALLYRVDAAGPACHTGARSCFDGPPAPRPAEDAVATGSGDRAGGPAGLELGWLWRVLAERAGADPAQSYTARLLAAGIDRAARKVGEEATEVVIAALRQAPPAGRASSVLAATAGGPSPLVAEAADLLYHLLVLLLATGASLDEVGAELRRRHARAATPVSAKPEERVEGAGTAPAAPTPPVEEPA